MSARAALALGLLVAVAAAGCGPRGQEAEPSPPPQMESAKKQPPAESPAGSVEGAPAPAHELPRMVVNVYFPAAEGDGLAAEPREIFETVHAADRAKQIISEILSGPQTPGAVGALPEGTRLRQVYVLDDGTAYADFTTELRDRLGGGSAQEILAVYAIVDSLALNVPEIRRVGILLEGKPLETLNGHLDLRRPLPADPTLLSERREAPASGA